MFDLGVRSHVKHNKEGPQRVVLEKIQGKIREIDEGKNIVCIVRGNFTVFKHKDEG